MSGEYLGDFSGTETLTVIFDSFDSNGASVTMTGLAVTDIEIYKGSSVTQRSSDAGFTLIDTDGIDIDGATGIHGFTVDLSDDTDSGFYASGNDYYIVVNSVTIDTQTVRFVAARFSIRNRSNEAIVSLLPTALVNGKMDSYVEGLTVGAGGISTASTGATVTTGVETLTYTSTGELDGTTHDVEDTAGSTEFYYEFSVGVTSVATEIRWDGYAQSNGDSYTIKGYDWVSASWKTVGTVSGTNTTTIIERTFITTRDMTGTGANAGIVRFQVTSSDGTKFATDRVVAEYTSLPEAGVILHSGIAQAGSSNTITLDTGANSADDFYNHAKVIISSGTGSEQERIIVDYNGTSKVATIAPPWITQPDATSAFEIEPGNCHAETGWGTIKVGIIQAATSTTATLDSTASAIDDFYNNELLHIDYGTGEGQVRVITDYNGTTKVATVHTAWTTTPDTTSEYLVEEAHPYVDAAVSSASAPTAASVADAVWDEEFSGHTTAGTYGKLVKNLGEGIVSIDGAVNDVGATVNTFITNLVEASDSHYSDLTLIFISGNLKGQAKPIASYNGTTKTIVLDEDLSEAPADTDEFLILAIHVHPVTQIAEGVRTEIDSNSTQLTAIVGDTNELQTDLTNGGRLDLILDELTTQGDTNETKIDTIDTVADGIKAVTDVLPDSGALTSLATSASLATVDGVVDAILVDTNELQTDLTDGGRLDSILDELTAQGDTNESKIDIIDVIADAILVDTATSIPALISALNDVTVSDILTTQMIESYATDGSAPTVAQSLFAIQQFLQERDVASTTVTVKKLDGSTTAYTLTTNDAATPTNITRSS